MFNEANSRWLHGLLKTKAFVLKVVIIFIVSIVLGIINKVSIKFWMI